MEYWDLYDKYGNKTGEIIQRGGGEKFPKDRYHIVVEIALYNDKGEYLIQHRTTTKEVYKGYWDFAAGGSAVLGENAYTAILRETEEEIGITLNEDDIKPLMTMLRSTCHFTFFTAPWNGDPAELRLQKEEVTEVRFASAAEIEKMIADGSFIPYSPGFLAFLYGKGKFRM